MISIFFIMETLDFDYGDSVIILASVMYILELAIEKGYIRRKGIINLLILVIIFLILIDLLYLRNLQKVRFLSGAQLFYCLHF